VQALLDTHNFGLPPTMRTRMLLSILFLAATSASAQPFPSLAPQSAQERPGPESHQADLLEAVSGLKRPGNSLPGEVIAFGDEAFLVATGGTGDGQRGVIGAAPYGKGRVVAFGHSSYFGAWDTEGSGPSFLANALRWSTTLENPRVAFLGGGEAMQAGLGPELTKLVGQIDARDFGRELAQLDGIVWVDGRLNDVQRSALDRFVLDGGGLLLGVCPWGNQQIWDGQGGGKSIRTDLDQNLLLGPMGLVFGDATVGDADYGLASTKSMPHAGRAVATAIRYIKREAGAGDSTPGATASAVAALLRALPPGDRRLLDPIEEALAESTFGLRVPSAKGPMQKSDVAGYLGMLLATEAWKSASPQSVQAAPGADFFPGLVAESAARTSVQLTFSPEAAAKGGWISTGRYAAPGEVVRVSISSDAKASGWSLRIGAHKDRLWHKDSWSRWPEITMEQRLLLDDDGSFEMASAFGGPVYLVPGKGARALELELAGTVEAPLFVLGDPESVRDWPRRRGAAAPWAELVCDGMILTVPAGAVRELDDPTALMQYWQRATECYPELRMEPQPARAERLVEDIQISAGWMHSGYPVMTHGAERTEHSFAVDLATLESEGNWGYFHEFGHNAQRPEWTFGGTGEVTCNLFSLYLGEAMAGVEPWDNPWLENQKKKPQQHFDSGADFAQWKKQPGLALMMYATIQRDFGWEPFQTAFEAYVAADRASRPRSDDAKRDTWLIRMSTALERDLGPYFEHWGVPTSIEARAQVSHFEPWMPKEYAKP
jgi:hypothetical protein